MVVNGLTAAERQAVIDIFGPALTPDAALNGPPARTCLKVGVVRRQFARSIEEKRQDVFKEIKKWDVAAAMELYEVERLHRASKKIKQDTRRVTWPVVCDRHSHAMMRVLRQAPLPSIVGSIAGHR